MVRIKKSYSAEKLETMIAKNSLTSRERILVQLLFDSFAGDKLKTRNREDKEVLSCPERGLKAGSEKRLEDDPALEKRIHSLTDYYDFDCPNMNYLLMLSVLGIRVKWKYFPPEIIPRLKGIHRYFQAKNVLGIPWLLEKLRVLRDHDIPVMLIKGLVLRYYYIPQIPRVMNDYDIAVPAEHFNEAMKLLRDGTVKDKGSAPWSDTIIGKCAGKDIELDVHQNFFKYRAAPEEEIWERAVPFDFYGIDVLIPSREDVLVNIFDAQARDFFWQQIPETRMKWIFDSGILMLGSDPEPDYEKVVAYAIRFCRQYTARLMLTIFSKCYRNDPFFRQLAERIQPVTREYSKWLKTEFQFYYELKRYKSYGYHSGETSDPIRIFRGLRLNYSIYQARCYNPQQNNEFNSFFHYLMEEFKIYSWKDFCQAVLLRFPLLSVKNNTKRKENDKSTL